MASKAFVLDSQRGLRPLERSEFLAEQQLDSYIERYPELLAGALSSDEESLRLILVETQAGIDDAANNASGRWAADAIFLDQDGVLTIVEDKLAKNAEIRRKIVGQMIEYAANLLVTFTPDGLLQRLRNRHGDDVNATLATLLQLPAEGAETESAIADFWARVMQNLQAGKIRMVFVADRMPSELRQIIEFLNRYMNPMEVLGVTVDCLRDPTIADGREVLVTSTIGASAQKGIKSPTARKDERIALDDFLKACDEVSDKSVAAEVTKRLIRRLTECESLEFPCHRTPTGDAVCIVVGQGDGATLFKARAEPGRRVFFHLGKREAFRETLSRLAGYDLPIHGKIAEWCAENEAHEQQFHKWVIDAATRGTEG
jgi:hypothetical protein